MNISLSGANKLSAHQWQTGVPIGTWSKQIYWTSGDLLKMVAVMPRGKTLIKTTMGEEAEWNVDV